MYAYCSNNPVMMHDPSGTSGEDAKQYGARAYVVPVDPENKKKGNTTLVYHQEGATGENKNKVALLNDKGEVTGVRDMTKEELSADAMSKKIGINEKTGKYTGVQALKSNISGQSPTQQVEKPKEATQLVTESVNPNQTQEGSSSESQKSTYEKLNDASASLGAVTSALGATIEKAAISARLNPKSDVRLWVPKTLTFNFEKQYTKTLTSGKIIPRAKNLYSIGRLKGSWVQNINKVMKPLGKLSGAFSILSANYNIFKDRKLSIGDVFEEGIAIAQIAFPAFGLIYGISDFLVSKLRKDSRGITQLIKEDVIDKRLKVDVKF